MNKDKLTDPRDNNIENKKEDYKDSNGNPEDLIEDMTDPEATDIFKEAFYAEGKALEEEALRSTFVEDEEKKEAMRLRIFAAVGRSTADVEAVERSVVDDAVKVSAEDGKRKKKRRFTPFMRWAAVLALVCLGVFGVSVTGQAKGSGLWSSIRWLIGGETRWENENNGEDRTYTNPEEEKAVGIIEENLGIRIPKFFYWPGELKYKDLESFEESNSFMMRYSDGENTVFFEGWKSESNASSNYTLQGEGDITYEEYDGISYAIIAVDNEVFDMSYYVMWSNSGYKYVLSGIRDYDELQKILKNIKN